jgi:hypothetical protein
MLSRIDTIAMCCFDLRSRFVVRCHVVPQRTQHCFFLRPPQHFKQRVGKTNKHTTTTQQPNVFDRVVRPLCGHRACVCVRLRLSLICFVCCFRIFELLRVELSLQLVAFQARSKTNESQSEQHQQQQQQQIL